MCYNTKLIEALICAPIICLILLAIFSPCFAFYKASENNIAEMQQLEQEQINKLDSILKEIN